MDSPTAVVARVLEPTRRILAGTIGGYRWAVQAKVGEAGVTAIEDGRLMLDRHAYGMCGPGAGTTAFELIDKRGRGIVYGYAAGHGPFSLRLRGPGVPASGAGTTSQVVEFPGGDGKFFIGALPRSACRYRSLTLDVSAGSIQSSSTINLGACRLDQPVELTSSSGTATGPGPATLLTTIALQPPTGTTAARGTARETSQGGRHAITIMASGLQPNTKHNAYAVWLYRSPARHLLLGFINPPVRRNGRLQTAGVLPKDAAAYNEILITLETSTRPRAPGPIVLAGRGRLR